MRTCQKCGTEFEGPKRGRPRHYCYACVPRTRALPPDTPDMPDEPAEVQRPMPPEPASKSQERRFAAQAVDVSEYTRPVNVLDREELERHEQAVNEATFPPVPMPPEPPVFDDDPEDW